jgi:hypothetical protein
MPEMSLLKYAALDRVVPIASSPWSHQPEVKTMKRNPAHFLISLTLLGVSIITLVLLLATLTIGLAYLLAWLLPGFDLRTALTPAAIIVLGTTFLFFRLNDMWQEIGRDAETDFDHDGLEDIIDYDAPTVIFTKNHQASAPGKKRNKAAKPAKPSPSGE